MNESVDQKLRASIGAIIVDKNKNFLVVQQKGFKKDEWDFIKGGMINKESELDTLRREIKEELGNKFIYKVLKRSYWCTIYRWENPINKDFVGQARVSYWVMYLGGEIKWESKEIVNKLWVSHDKVFSERLIASRVKDKSFEILASEWKTIQELNSAEFIS